MCLNMEYGGFVRQEQITNKLQLLMVPGMYLATDLIVA